MIASVGFLRTKLQLLHAICGVRETPWSWASAETIKPLTANTVAAKNPNARPSESCRETTERRNIGNSFYYRGESRTSESVTIYSCCDHRRWRCASSSKKRGPLVNAVGYKDFAPTEHDFLCDLWGLLFKASWGSPVSPGRTHTKQRGAQKTHV